MKTLFILFTSCLIQAQLMATHIVGGELTYAHQNGNTYQVKLKLYIDCYNGNPNAINQDLYANFVVFEGDSGKLLNSLCQSVLRSSPVRVSKTNYNCIKISPDACVDAYEYITTMELPPIKGGYYISFQRCCRNNTIVNIVNPLSTGENIWTKVNDTTGFGFNSSPEFKNLPPNFLCTNAPLIFDHSATDADGDSLVYEFFHPYTGANSTNPRPDCAQYQKPPFSQILFENGYSQTLAIPSSPLVNLNRSSGLLQLTPTLQGQFVVGIVVKEYRRGKLIGSTQRDYQFNVQNCVFETTSAFVNPAVNCNREVFFTNNSTNADSYSWFFGDSTTFADTSHTQNAYYRYPLAGTYRVKLIAAKGNCVDSVIKNVTVFDRIQFKLPDDIKLCAQKTIPLFPDTFYRSASYLWNNGSTDSLILVTQAGQYWLNITIGNCNTSDTVQIINDNLPVTLLRDSLYCNTLSQQLEAILRVNGRYNSIVWSFDGQEINGHTDSVLNISEKGLYVIRGLNVNNCLFADSVQIPAPDLSRLLKTPNVFTPNGDSINDVFPDPNPPYLYKLKVFNRWGILVFQSENIPWRGANFADGTYYYFIELSACGTENKYHGAVKVMR